MVLAALAAAGCGLNQEGIGPPSDRIFYPGAIAVDPSSGRYLYVVNSNADLRFNDGTLLAIDLDVVNGVHEGARPASGAPPDKPKDVCSNPKFINQVSGDAEYCCWDALDRNVLNCDERQFVVASAAVKIGSFGSALQIQTLDSSTPDHQQQRLLTAVRGNASVTWVDATIDSSGISFSCTAGSAASGFVECDLGHRVTQTSTVLGQPTPLENPLLLPEEPYALAIDPAQKLLYVGHLRGGFLSALNLAGGNPTLIGAFGGIFPGDINGSVGVTSLTLTAEGINDGRIYATSRYLPRAGSFAPISLGQIDDSGDKAVNNQKIFLGYAGDPFVSPLNGSEVRGIQPIPAIHRTFLLQRTPPVLVGFDTGGQSGQNLATDILEMCNGPTFLHMYPPFDPAGDAGLGKRLFVNCFEAGQVYVVDPYVPRLLAIIEVGRGPAGLAFNPKNPNRAYVVGFGSNNVSVVDLDPTSATRYHVIQRIGFPNPVPR